MPILNIFAFGTSQNSQDGKDIVMSSFANACVTDNKNLKYIIEGPNLFGLDVEGKIDAAVDKLFETFATTYDQKPNIVNIFSYSRGGVIATAIANRCKKLLPHVEFNILALDPVAGPGAKGDHNKRCIPANVKNYIAFLMMDETRAEMKSQSRKRTYVENPTLTHAVFLPLPGNHNTPIRVSTKKPEQIHVPLMVHAYAYHFLTAHGARFTANIMPEIAYKDEEKGKNSYSRKSIDTFGMSTSAKDLLEAYAKMSSAKPEYQKLRGKKSVQTSFTNLEEYTWNSDFFINEHHSDLFKTLYPLVFDYLFQQAREMKAEEKEREVELQTLARECPALLNTLVKLRGVKNKKEEQPKLPSKPRGLYHIKTIQTLPDAIQKDELLVLTQTLMQEMRFYQTDRPWFGFRKSFHLQADQVINYILKVRGKNSTADKLIQRMAEQFSQWKLEVEKSRYQDDFGHYLQRLADYCQKIPVSPLPNIRLSVPGIFSYLSQLFGKIMQAIKGYFSISQPLAAAPLAPAATVIAPVSVSLSSTAIAQQGLPAVVTSTSIPEVVTSVADKEEEEKNEQPPHAPAIKDHDDEKVKSAILQHLSW